PRPHISTPCPYTTLFRSVNNSRPGQVIYDPFLGSGTSLIAAEMTGRICYGLELSPAYSDVVVRRWQLFTGRAARHQASGQELPADRKSTRLNSSHVKISY